jgi:hypothetical protein
MAVISTDLPELTLSYVILDYKNDPSDNGFFNIYVKCNGFIITKMVFSYEPKYLDYLASFKQNISKMKRGVSMNVKKGLQIDNVILSTFQHKK